MRYVDHVLQPGESIRHVTTVSWIGYLRGLFLFVIAGIVLIITPPAASAPGLHLVGLVIAIVIFAIGLVLVIRAWWHRFTTEVAVTDRRIIYKTGFINRHSVEMHMDKVESVDVDQSILGRILNYGNVRVRGVGEGVKTIATIASPLAFRNHITAR